MIHIWGLTKTSQEEVKCVYCKCVKLNETTQPMYCSEGTAFIQKQDADIAQAKVDIQDAVNTIPMRSSDKLKLLSKGWDLMMWSFNNPGPQGMTNGWLSVKLLHKLTVSQLKGLRMNPYAACVGVNSGRVHRELLRRELM